MGGNLATPAVYVDGIEVDDLTYDAISKLITLKLKQKGVN